MQTNRLQTVLSHVFPKVQHVAQASTDLSSLPRRLARAKLAAQLPAPTTSVMQPINQQESDAKHTLAKFATSSKSQLVISYLNKHDLVNLESLQAGVLLVAHPRANVRRQFIQRLCQAAMERSALVYAIAASGSPNVQVEGVFTLATHPTLSRRAILNALLRHGAHLLIFGTISTRDDVMALMDATYTGYHCVAEIYGESAQDVLSRLEGTEKIIITVISNWR